MTETSEPRPCPRCNNLPVKRQGITARRTEYRCESAFCIEPQVMWLSLNEWNDQRAIDAAVAEAVDAHEKIAVAVCEDAIATERERACRDACDAVRTWCDENCETVNVPCEKHQQAIAAIREGGES